METLEIIQNELTGHKLKMRDLQASVLEIKSNINIFEQKQREVENLVEQEIGIIKTLEFVVTLLKPNQTKSDQPVPKSSTKSKV
jgi:hypothetical protein